MGAVLNSSYFNKSGPRNVGAVLKGLRIFPETVGAGLIRNFDPKNARAVLTGSLCNFFPKAVCTSLEFFFKFDPRNVGAVKRFSKFDPKTVGAVLKGFRDLSPKPCLQF